MDQSTRHLLVVFIFAVLSSLAFGCTTVVSPGHQCGADEDCASGVCDFSGEVAVCTADGVTIAPNPSMDPTVEPEPRPEPEPTVDPEPEPVDPMFPGFDSMELFVGAHWDYRVTHESSSSGSSTRRTTGTVRIELVSQVDVPYEGYVIPFFAAEGSIVEGSLPESPSFKYYNYYAVVDGIVLVGGYLESGEFDFGILFDPIGGRVAENGAMGYFSTSRDERMYAGTFQGSAAVVVDEPYYKPQCETIAGVRICDEESHDYQVREYYSPGVGFAGFHRSGTSIFSGGGFTSIHSSSYDVALVASNLLSP